MQNSPMHERHGVHACANLNLVAPLATQATASRITDTADIFQAGSSAVGQLIQSDLFADVDSAISRSTAPTTPGIRTAMATRTGTTRTTRGGCAQSADSLPPSHADFSLTDLLQAYYDCRRNKRNSGSAIEFEHHLERNLTDLYRHLQDGTYQPGKSICFVVTRPKAREVWAADFRDRIVHHLLYNHVCDRFYRRFIPDSCACIPGRGTLYAATRLAAKIRSATQNWSIPAFYLKCDLANFFVSIDKNILLKLLARHITEPFWMALADTILFHDPRTNYDLRSSASLVRQVPPHKRLIEQPADRGLPIGNLSSQFFANVYLNDLDQFCKHKVDAKHYVRYVDDFVLLHSSPQWLNAALEQISAFLPDRLHARLNTKKTILQPVDRGVDFVGHVIKPWSTTTRRRTVVKAIKRLEHMPAADLHQSVNSYFGLFRQAPQGMGARRLLARAALRRGRCIDAAITKTYRISRMKTIAQMLTQVEGLCGTQDVSAWEDEFITSVLGQYRRLGNDTTRLSGKQVEIIERIWRKHFT